MCPVVDFGDTQAAQNPVPPKFTIGYGMLVLLISQTKYYANIVSYSHCVSSVGRRVLLVHPAKRR